MTRFFWCPTCGVHHTAEFLRLELTNTLSAKLPISDAILTDFLSWCRAQQARIGVTVNGVSVSS
jgi:hypothetical protein